MVALLLIASLTLFNEAAPVPLCLPSVFHNPLDEEEAEKIFCIENESLEERTEEDSLDHFTYISGGAGDVNSLPCGFSGSGSTLPHYQLYNSVFQSVNSHASRLLRTMVGRPFYILFQSFKAFLLSC